MLFLIRSNDTKESTHGMDHTEARRDRPELRNQLLRQRRTLVSDSPLAFELDEGTIL